MFESNAIAIMKKAGISFCDGLTGDELIAIHRIYGITFPAKVRQFMTNALPISKGFYNWRDTNPSNVEHIKRSIETPVLELLEEYQSIPWNPNWGTKPVDAELPSFFREKLASSAMLIPFYSHRYIPMIDVDDPPVLSITGSDIIVYAQTFSEYVSIEFGRKKFRPVSLQCIPNIPFWSDIL